MPTYEYKCTSCGHQFERWQSMKSEALTECPECGGLTKRMIFPVGVIFKGSGFYVTDTRKSSGEETASSSSSSSSSTPSSSPSSTPSPSSNGDKAEKKDSKPEPAKAASG